MKKKHMRWFLGTLAVIMLVITGYVLLVCLPFAGQEKISETMKNEVKISDFQGEGSRGESAMVIADNGEALTERVRLIANAKSSIVMSVFDMHADRSGKIVMSALLEAAKRGVKVKVLIDGFPWFVNARGNPIFKALGRCKNVEIRIYNPIHFLKPWKLMGRMHDKYLIADDQTYILGGRNTYDFFLGDQKGYKNYDWDVLVCREKKEDPEASVFQVKSYFEKIWEGGDCKVVCKEKTSGGKVKTAGQELEQIYKDMQKSHKDWTQPTDYAGRAVPVSRVRLVANPIHVGLKQPVVYDTITGLMGQANGPCVFHTPYIISNDWMRKRLKEVCRENPDITMMTNSVANNGNPFGAIDYQNNKEKILKTGVKILEFDNGISYHGKCFTLGKRLSGVGSFNWDMRSTYLDTELMLVLDSEALNRQLREKMAAYEKDAFRVTGVNIYAEAGEMQTISPKRKRRIFLLRPIVKIFRFLM